jgi:hypothetical protein
MRRPAIRSLVGGAAGIAAGLIGGIALTGMSSAGSSLQAPSPDLDATHVPPALTVAGERVTLRYAIVCGPHVDGEPCDGSGELFVRSGQDGAFERIALTRGDDSAAGRYYAELPARLTGSPAGFSYYTVLRDDTTGRTVTLPSGGAAAPERSFPLRAPAEVALGAHTFGRTRGPSARVVSATWGNGPRQLGLAGSRELGFAGPSSFDVDAAGTVTVLDQVNARAQRWRRDSVETVPLDLSGDLADFAVEPNGTMDVLEPPNRTLPVPMLRSFRGDGTPRWTQRLSDRTWAKLALGPDGPAVQQQPSEQWLPVSVHGLALGRERQAERGRPGRPLADGGELVVARVGPAELRLAELNGNAIGRNWRITSSTPLGEVQLAEPLRSVIVVVLKTYTDERAEYLVLLLDHAGAVQRFAVQPSEWAESAPLARFRLAGSSLYQLGSTPAGAFVYRFDLEVAR